MSNTLDALAFQSGTDNPGLGFLGKTQKKRKQVKKLGTSSSFADYSDAGTSQKGKSKRGGIKKESSEKTVRKVEQPTALN